MDRSELFTAPLVLARVVGGRENNPDNAVPGLLGWPKGFTVDDDGLIIVADSSNNRIQASSLGRIVYTCITPLFERAHA
jgi:hypothetical protein